MGTANHIVQLRGNERMKTVIVFILSVLVAAPVLAQPPINGFYKTTDLGGLMLPGHYSEYWVIGTGLNIGNTMNEESWDGATRSIKNTPVGIISRLFGGGR